MAEKVSQIHHVKVGGRTEKYPFIIKGAVFFKDYLFLF